MKHKHHSDHMKPIHHDQPKQAHVSKSISAHDHPDHKGPHHDIYIHDRNKVSMKGSHQLGDTSHLSSLEGEPSGDDVVGHSGKM